jgi:neutral ceramidase
VRTRDAYKRKDRPGSNVGDEVQTEIMVLRAGDLGFVSMPGELFSEFNTMLRDASPMPQTVVVSLANDYVGYLPTDVGQEQGAYETRMAPAEGIEGMIMEHAARAFAAATD